MSASSLFRPFVEIDTPAHARDTWGFKGWQTCFQGKKYNTCPDNVQVSRLLAAVGRPSFCVGWPVAPSRSREPVVRCFEIGRRSGLRSGPEPHELRVHAVSAQEGPVHGGANGHDGEQVWYVHVLVLNRIRPASSRRMDSLPSYTCAASNRRVLPFQ
jgi:hypothetical protein